MKLRLLFAVAAMLLLAGCQQTTPGADSDLAIDRAKNPDARYIEGTLVALHSARNSMIVAASDSSKRYEVRYDFHTKFFVDGTPASLVDIRQYMQVKIRGHMVYPEGMTADGTCYIDVAKFTSPMPNDVPPSAQAVR